MDNTFFLYADPGAGALILQMIMAVIFGGLFFVRSIRDRVLGVFGRGPYARVDTEKTDSAENNEGVKEKS